MAKGIFGSAPRLSARPGLIAGIAFLFPFLTNFVAAAETGQPAGGGFSRAAANGRLVAEGLERCHRFLHAWLAAAEPASGLIPRNLMDSPYWNGKDSAADNYPFMVLSAHLTDRAVFDGAMHRMLANEQKLTARPGWLRLTDDYNLKGTPGLRFAEPQAQRILFNSAEYAKDGLLALTEWLGDSPWSKRMFALIDDSFALAAAETPFGPVPVIGLNKESGVEISGDYLQVLARGYWMSGRNEKYLQWGARIADLYLLPEGKHHPTRDFTALRLRDHGCEIINGLCEFYATAALAGKLPNGEAWAKKKAAYQPHLHEMLDRILATARNEDGLFHNEVNPQTGAILDARVSDTWGYVLDGFYTIYLIDGIGAYREAALKALGALNAGYRRFAWEAPHPPDRPLGSQDGYADSIEGALNLANREPNEPRAASALAWIDSEIQHLWSCQQPGGLIEGWHGDGNFARTTILFCLWKSQGVTHQPWRADVRVGAVREGAKLLISVSADQPWSGALSFDHPRHAGNLGLPLDWPRINQFPEWFTVRPGQRYTVSGLTGGVRTFTGAELRKGLPVHVTGAELRLEIFPAP